MTPTIALHADALREVMAAAALVPVESRALFLERVRQRRAALFWSMLGPP
jgi:hypothetical protein